MRTPFTKTALVAMLSSAFLAAAAPSAIAGKATVDTGGVAGSPGGAPAAGHVQGALATWFGPGFYGRRTACGQLLTASVLGLANRTLPCGTLVTVAYRGRRATLPVIDRGPYAGNGAEWDLTLQAARALGIADTARIAARVVGSARNTPTLGLPPAPAAGLAPAVGILAATGGIRAG